MLNVPVAAPCAGLENATDSRSPLLNAKLVALADGTAVGFVPPMNGAIWHPLDRAAAGVIVPTTANTAPAATALATAAAVHVAR